jgi:hypothetical protein
MARRTEAPCISIQYDYEKGLSQVGGPRATGIASRSGDSPPAPVLRTFQGGVGGVGGSGVCVGKEAISGNPPKGCGLAGNGYGPVLHRGGTREKKRREKR